MAATFMLTRLSVKLTPVSGGIAAGFALLMVIVSTVSVLTGTVAGLNDLPLTGGAKTSSVACAGVPSPPFEDVGVAVLFFGPAAGPVTFTTMGHDDAPASENGVIEIVDPPGAAVTPVQVPPIAGGVATVSPAGRRSVKVTPVSGTGFG